MIHAESVKAWEAETAYFQKITAQQRAQIAELTAVLEMIACLRHDSNPSAASLAKSALDTMRLLDKPESTMEHIARDIKAGIFPRKSEP